jgi:hypothetical protein
MNDRYDFVLSFLLSCRTSFETGSHLTLWEGIIAFQWLCLLVMIHLGFGFQFALVFMNTSYHD